VGITGGGYESRVPEARVAVNTSASTQTYDMAAFGITFWLATVFYLVFTGIQVGFMSGGLWNQTEREIAAIWLTISGILGFGLGIAAAVIWFIKLHRAWKVIQSLRREDSAETNMPTPGQAVGFLFIPFFNLYWFFVATVGLARRVNKYLSLRRIQAEPMPVGLAIAMCICGLLLNWIPFLGIIVNSILGFCFVVNMNRVTNEILAAEEAQRF